LEAIMGQFARKIKIGLRYYAKGQHLNVPYCSRAIFLTKKQAQKWERLEKERIEAELRNPRPKILLKDIMERRLDDIQARKSKDYYRENRRYFRLAMEKWGNQDILDISKAMVSDLIAGEASRLTSQGRTYHKANSLLRALKALFNYASRLYDTNHNPCNLDFYPIDIGLKHIPPDKDIDAVRELCTPGQRLLLDFADQTACRINEAVRFRYEDIEPDGIILWTRKSRNSNPALDFYP
jgi:integrase